MGVSKTFPATNADEGLPQPTVGHKEYTDEEGNVTCIVEWFGYKLHLLIDTQHEVVLAYQTTAASADDGQMLPALVRQAHAMPLMLPFCIF